MLNLAARRGFLVAMLEEKGISGQRLGTTKVCSSFIFKFISTFMHGELLELFLLFYVSYICFKKCSSLFCKLVG